MAVVVSLRDFVDEMQTLSDEIRAYVSKSTGEVISVTNDEFSIVEENNGDWSEYDKLEQEFFQKVEKIVSSDEFLELPNQYEIHEHEIMERFCLSISDEEVSDVLLDKISGSGAFRKFKDTVYRYGIEKDWFRFKDEAYKEIAVSWLKSHGFEYADDMNRREKSI